MNLNNEKTLKIARFFIRIYHREENATKNNDFFEKMLQIGLLFLQYVL
jgi:hypothetical protein